MTGLVQIRAVVFEVAELLGATERFPRRLIAEQRIRFVPVGHHVLLRVRQGLSAWHLTWEFGWRA
jgi:excisionase family DNA binding protein